MLSVFRIIKIIDKDTIILDSVLKEVLDRALLSLTAVLDYLKTDRRLIIPAKLQGDSLVYLSDCLLS